MDPTNELLMFRLIYLFILASYLSVFGGNIYFLCLVIQILLHNQNVSTFFNCFVHKHPQATPYNAEVVICSLNVRGLSKS